MVDELLHQGELRGGAEHDDRLVAAGGVAQPAHQRALLVAVVQPRVRALDPALRQPISPFIRQFRFEPTRMSQTAGGLK